MQANPDEITLPDGRTVPTKAVQALSDYDNNVWPNAVEPEARASVAYAVLTAVATETEPALRTNYPFCLAKSPVKDDTGSPCIKRADHGGQHQNNNDEVWV